MEKHFDINTQGLSVRCRLFYDKDPTAIEDMVLILHGFGSSKDLKSNTKFGERLIAKYKNYGAIAFDLPAHGSDAHKKLTVTAGLHYIQLVTDYAKDKFHAKRLYAYATSFGGYLILKYIAERNNPFCKIALRAPAIQMHQTLLANMSEEERTKISKGKEVMLGFERKIKIGPEFIDELRQGDITQYDYLNAADNLLIIHGGADETVPLASSQAFAENNVIDLITVEGADHPFSNPKLMDQAIGKIIDFLRVK